MDGTVMCPPMPVITLKTCIKIDLSIKEKQAARACSFIIRQALIFAVPDNWGDQYH